MRIATIASCFAALLGLSACGDTNEEQAATGALGGAVVGTAVGGPVLGTAVGAAAGVAVD